MRCIDFGKSRPGPAGIGVQCDKLKKYLSDHLAHKYCFSRQTLEALRMEKPKTAPVIHERPKMPRATWEALRNHIIKERRRK